MLFLGSLLKSWKIWVVRSGRITRLWKPGAWEVWSPLLSLLPWVSFSLHVCFQMISTVWLPFKYFFYYVDDVFSFGILTLSHCKHFRFYCRLYFSLSSFPLNLSHLRLCWHAHTVHTLFHPKSSPYFILYAPFFPYSVHAQKNSKSFINA